MFVCRPHIFSSSITWNTACVNGAKRKTPSPPLSRRAQTLRGTRRSPLSEIPHRLRGGDLEGRMALSFHLSSALRITEATSWNGMNRPPPGIGHGSPEKTTSAESTTSAAFENFRRFFAMETSGVCARLISKRRRRRRTSSARSISKPDLSRMKYKLGSRPAFKRAFSASATTRFSNNPPASGSRAA